jgi:hypothetical protein
MPFERLLTEVGNVTSKRNGVTPYHFSHVIRDITIKSDNIFYEPRVTTVRSDNAFHKPRVITIKKITFLHSVEALCDNAKM